MHPVYLSCIIYAASVLSYNFSLLPGTGANITQLKNRFYKKHKFNPLKNISKIILQKFGQSKKAA